MWDAAGAALNVEFIRKEASQITVAELEGFIKSGTYPIVRVRMPLTGNYHFVLLVGADEGDFLCMDPLNENHEIVSLAKFNHKIYAVRYCK